VLWESKLINPLGDRSPLSDLHRHYSPYGLTTAHKNIPCLLTDWNSHKKKSVWWDQEDRTQDQDHNNILHGKKKNKERKPQIWLGDLIYHKTSGMIKTSGQTSLTYTPSCQLMGLMWTTVDSIYGAVTHKKFVVIFWGIYTYMKVMYNPIFHQKNMCESDKDQLLHKIRQAVQRPCQFQLLSQPHCRSFTWSNDCVNFCKQKPKSLLFQSASGGILQESHALNPDWAAA
jgi:hypothetical protein